MWQMLLSLPQRLLMLAVRGYRFLLKPWLGSACRFEPTCSQYALDALARHGAAGGVLLTAGRLLRCHPWCEGGCDPAPENFPNPARGLFTRFSRPSADDTPNARPRP